MHKTQCIGFPLSCLQKTPGLSIGDPQNVSLGLCHVKLQTNSKHHSGALKEY